MQIRRIVNGQEYAFDLAFEEKEEAYKDLDFNYKIEDIKNILEIQNSNIELGFSTQMILEDKDFIADIITLFDKQNSSEYSDNILYQCIKQIIQNKICLVR